MIKKKFLSLFGVDVCLDQTLLFLTIEGQYRRHHRQYALCDRRGVCRLVVYPAPGWQSCQTTCPDSTGERIRYLHRAPALTSVCHESGGPMALSSTDAASK